MLPRGTTTAICDPHEIANVLGVAGIRYFLDGEREPRHDAAGQSQLVRAGDRAGDRGRPAGGRPTCCRCAPIRRPSGLAEMMNFPGVLAKDPGLLAKLDAFAGGHVDGHAPAAARLPLNAYLAAGIRTDHECTQLEEAREKLAKGMFVLMREGSIAKNVAALAPLLTDLTWPRIAFCTDDRNPLEIVEEGHIDAAMRKAIAAGAPPLAAYRAASLGAAMAFGLSDRGLIARRATAPTSCCSTIWRACAVAQVICGGRLVEPELFAGRSHPRAGRLRLGRRAPVAAELFARPAPPATTPGDRRASILADHRPSDAGQHAPRAPS